MAKYRDKTSMGKSELCPKKRYESWRQRHSRRKHVASQSEAELDKWCQERFMFLQVNNEGHHWIIRRFDAEEIDLQVEWWPSSAKAVTGTDKGRFRRGIHCHDVEQLKAIIEREIERQR